MRALELRVHLAHSDSMICPEAARRLVLSEPNLDAGGGLFSRPGTVIFGARSSPDSDTKRLPEAGVTVRVVPDAGLSMIRENPSGYAEALQAALS